MNSATFFVLCTLSVILLTPLTAIAYVRSGMKLTVKDEDGNYVYPDDYFHYLHSWFPSIVLAAMNIGLFAKYGGGSTMTLTIIIMVALYILGVIWGLVARFSASKLLTHGRNPWIVHLIGVPILVVFVGTLVLSSLTLTQPEVSRAPVAQSSAKVQELSQGYL